jgi:hypothetical protein
MGAACSEYVPGRYRHRYPPVGPGAPLAGAISFGALNVYLQTMPSKPIELPPSVAKAFVKDMHAFLAAPNTFKQDEIAARQLQALNEHRRPRDKPLRLADVKQMFLEMRDHA